MRVIAGRLGGQSFASPNGHRTHPMSDKVRGALFNSLGDITGLTFLDAFAGSGALSFEAISRGARAALAIDNDRSAQTAIEANIRKLGLDNQVRLIKANVNSWQKATNDHFAVVLCDPPYNSTQLEVVEKLAERAEIGGVIVFSLPPGARLLLSEKYKQLSYKKYGDAELYFYRRES